MFWIIYCWMSGKQCRLWSDAAFCGVWSVTTLHCLLRPVCLKTRVIIALSEQIQQTKNYFPRKQALTFNASCLETICKNCQRLFAGKNKKNILSHLLNFLPSMLSISNHSGLQISSFSSNLYIKPIMEICLFVLRFYSPVNLLGSCWVRAIYLTTLFFWAGLVL